MTLKNHTSRYTTLHRMMVIPLMVIAAIAVTLSAAGKKSRWDTEADLRKADYVFTQGSIATAMDSDDRAARLYEYAYTLNPTDPNIRVEHALGLARTLGDSLSADEAFRSIVNLFLQDPTDYANGISAIMAAEYLHEYDQLVRLQEMVDSLWPAKADGLTLADAYIKKSIYNRDSAAYNRAMDIYDRIERGTGINVGLISQRVRAMSTRGYDTTNIQAMCREVSRLVTALPNDVDAMVYAGVTYHQFDRDSLAREILERAVRLDPNNSDAVVSLSKFYEAVGDSISADREAICVLENTGVDIEAKIEMLRDYVNRRTGDSTQYPALDSLMQRVLDINPGEPRLHAIYAAFLEFTGRPEAQAEQMGYAIDLDPTNDDLRTYYIQALAKIEDSTRISEVARQGMKMSPQNFYYPIILANILFKSGDTGGALALMDSVVVDDVKNHKAVATLYTVHADLLTSVDSIQQAIDLYERAIKLDPENFMAYNNAAYNMAVREINLDVALNYARYAVLSDMESPTFLDTYAWVYFKLKNYPEAKSYIDKALEVLDYPVAAEDSTITADSTIKVDSTAKADSTVKVDSTVTADSTVKAEPSVTDDSNANDEYSGISEVLEHAGDIYFMYGLPERAIEFWQEAAKHGTPSELLMRKVKNRTYFYK